MGAGHNQRGLGPQGRDPPVHRSQYRFRFLCLLRPSSFNFEVECHAEKGTNQDNQSEDGKILQRARHTTSMARCWGDGGPFGNKKARRGRAFLQSVHGNPYLPCHRSA